jgi:hypothetical protein
MSMGIALEWLRFQQRVPARARQWTRVTHSSFLVVKGSPVRVRASAFEEAAANGSFSFLGPE